MPGLAVDQVQPKPAKSPRVVVSTTNAETDRHGIEIPENHGHPPARPTPPSGWLGVGNDPRCSKFRFGSPRDRAEQIEAALEAKAGPARKPAFPASDLEQSFAVHDLLAASPAPLTAADIAGLFRQGRRIETQVAAVLAALERMGRIARTGGGRFTLRLDRAA